LIRQLLIRGATCALPVVVAPRTPLVFRQWDVDTKMGTGVYDIPMPLDTAEVSPDVVIAPLHGFDPRGFRLGYGSGYFDRTLAALQNRPITVGVGFEISRLDSIYPQSHDIPLDFIVTEAGARRSPAGGMQAGGAQKATDAFRVGPSANFNGEVGQQARRL
jgi:5-formyltetrahydrofolate cyclo-ligase